MRRYIQDLPLKTSTVSDYNVGVSGQDAPFGFTGYYPAGVLQRAAAKEDHRGLQKIKRGRAE